MDERIVMHVDLDAFFASAEQKSDPRLRGRPVAVCGGVNSRTVVSASSYEAKSFGVRSGMPPREALLRCPGLELVEANPAKYSYISSKIAGLFSRYTDLVEMFSIDEAFLDLTRTHHLFGGAEAAGAEIKQKIWTFHGLRASVGIGPNKLLAKLATGMGKPDGLVRIRSEEAAGVLENLPPSALCGVGKAAARVLASMGISSCGELAAAPAGLLREKFGIYGEMLGRMGRGRDDSPVRARPARKSVGRSLTLEKDTRDPERVRAVILMLSERVSADLRSEGFECGAVSLRLRRSDFSERRFSRKQGEYTDDPYRIYTACSSFLSGYPSGLPVRMAGVGVSRLRKARPQMLLFEEDKKRRALQEAVDGINRRMGGPAVMRAAVLLYAGSRA